MPTSGQSKPTFVADSTATANPTRADNYGGAMVSPVTGKEWLACAEGSYFVGVTPTPGTGIICHAAPTTFDEAKAIIVLYNSATASTCIYPQFIQLHSTVASVGGTGLQFTVCVDSTNRRSSAGTALTVANCNMNSSTAAVGTATVGAVVSTAATAARRIIGNCVLRPMTQIDIIEDFIEINFGGMGAITAGAPATPTTLGTFTKTMPPVCIGPGQSFLIHEWRGSQSTGPTYEWIMGWIER